MREGLQRDEAPSAYGNVKVCKDLPIILIALGARYEELFAEASAALFPELPEAAVLFAVLSFNTLERGRLAFYDGQTLGKLSEDDTPDVRSWSRKLPEDNGELYRKVATLMKWS